MPAKLNIKGNRKQMILLLKENAQIYQDYLVLIIIIILNITESKL